MKFGGGGKINVPGLDEVLRNINKANDALKRKILDAVSAMGNVALYGAVLRAPVDKHMLEESIQKNIQLDDRFLGAFIVVPVNSAAAKYAVEQHELDFKPGFRTMAKTNKTGIKAGKKYITRGVESGKEDYKTILKERLNI